MGWHNFQFGRPIAPLPALSKRKLLPVSVKFWKWPRMPLNSYLDRGPGLAATERYGKYGSSMTGHARKVLGRVGIEGRGPDGKVGHQVNIRRVGPVADDDFAGGLCVFTNDDALYEMLTSRTRELDLDASYLVGCSQPVTEEQIKELLLPSVPAAKPDSDSDEHPDGLADLGLGLRMPPRPFEVKAISRVVRPYGEEPDLHQMQVTLPAHLGATELRAHALRTAGVKITHARCDVFAGMSLHGLASNGHLAQVTDLEIDWLNERSAAADAKAPAAQYHWVSRRPFKKKEKQAALQTA